jgi:hypothetical protein
MDTSSIKRILFVDDKRRPPFVAQFAAGNTTAISFLEKIAALPEEERFLESIWLDYNLPFKGNTQELARWLANNHNSANKIRVDKIYIHSNDVIGRNILREILADFECLDAELPDSETVI